jgi:hypothetical protein
MAFRESARACWLTVVQAQPPAMPVIGWLSGSNANTDDLGLPAFRQTLAARGYVEGRNLKVEYRFAEWACLIDCRHSPETSFALVLRSSLGKRQEGSGCQEQH